MTMLIATVIIVAMVYGLIKKYETRMVLIAGGLGLGLFGRRPDGGIKVLLCLNEASQGV